MMHPQHLGCGTDPAQTRHLSSGADFTPEIQAHSSTQFCTSVVIFGQFNAEMQCSYWLHTGAKHSRRRIQGEVEMLNKLVIAAVAASFAVPALASEINPGRQMQADLLGLDASQFTTNELAQIASEKLGEERASRAAFITAQKGTGVLNLVSGNNVAGLYTVSRAGDK
ncbi:hypothetical protein [Paracoccus sp. J56]|nr:hypothetical protein [Paracoccus sp. J56]